jgi:HEAT repeat protein
MRNKNMRYDLTKFNPTPRGVALMIATALILIAGGAVRQASAQEYAAKKALGRFAQQGSNATANSMFSSGRDLIDDGQWAKAEEKFTQYVSAYPKEKSADAAMYWMAYSQYKLRKFDQCKDTIARLLKTYEKTAWKEDAQMLLAQVPNGVTVRVDPITVAVDPVVDVQVNAQDIQERVADAQARAEERAREVQARAEERSKEIQERVQERMKDVQEKLKDKSLFKYNVGDFDFDFDPETKGQSKSSDDDPCEFKIVVLQALFQSDVQRGIAAATDWVQPGSQETVRCKGAALTLLARHGGKAVTPTILRVAQNETDMKLRTRAISVLGSTNDDSVIDPLRDFALNSQQTEISEAALYALSQHSGARAETVLAEIAMSNKPTSLRRTAISSISGRQGEPAVDALFKIYDSTQDLEIRKTVIRGLGNRRSERAGAKLLEIARSSDNVELRKGAISSIGRRGGDKMVDDLFGLYGSEKDEGVKDQIISSLGYSNDQRVIDRLIEIAKNPQTPMERRRRIVIALSNHPKDPKVQKFLEDLLKQ